MSRGSPKNQMLILDHFDTVLQMANSPDVSIVRTAAALLFELCDSEDARKEILVRYPEVPAAIYKMAASTDRETSIAALVALASLVLAPNNKLILQKQGMLKEVGKMFHESASKPEQAERAHYLMNVMAGWFYGWPENEKLSLTPVEMEMILMSIQQMAETFLSNGLPEASIIAFKEVIKMDPANGFNHMLLGRTLASAKYYKDAIETLEVAHDKLIEMAERIGNPQLYGLALDTKLYRAALLARHGETDELKQEGAEILNAMFDDDLTAIKPQAAAEYALLSVESSISCKKYDEAVSKYIVIYHFIL